MIDPGKKNYLFIITASVLIGAYFSLLLGSGFFDSWRNKLIDNLFLQKEASDEIVIVAIDDESLQQLGRWPWDRSVFADLVEKISQQDPAVIGVDVNFPEPFIAEQDEELGRIIREAGNVILPLEAEMLISEKTKPVVSDILKPIDVIADGAAGLGFSNAPPDRDGVFRKMPISASDKGGREYRPFSLAAVELYLENNNRSLPLIPTNDAEQMLVNFAGKPSSFNAVSAYDVMEGNASDIFRDKIVLIGATAPDLHDEQMTPTSSGEPMSGVEIHANIMHTVLKEDFLNHLSFKWQALLLIVLAAAVSLVLMYFRVIIGSVISLALLGAYLTVALVIFDTGIILDIFYAILVFISVYIAAVAWRYLVEKKEKQKIKSAFAHYVSPEVIDDLLIHPEKLCLGGEKRTITILFSDIRGFTTISEKLKPEELVSLLNEYLSAMTELIMGKRGVVDKYIGDAVMAFWGAPLDDENHEAHGLDTALAMIDVLKSRQAEWHEKYGVDLKIGIGLNQGEAIIGNMGSDRRFDYTAMGDTVNLGSRLEGLTKQYGAAIIASEFVREKTHDRFVFRYLDKVAVKGKEEGVAIYELIGRQGEVRQEKQDLVDWFEKGLRPYREQKWQKAAEFFETLLLKYPEDGPTKVYLERAREYNQHPPQNWDGIYHAKSK